MNEPQPASIHQQEQDRLAQADADKAAHETALAGDEKSDAGKAVKSAKAGKTGAEGTGDTGGDNTGGDSGNQ